MRLCYTNEETEVQKVTSPKSYRQERAELGFEHSPFFNCSVKAVALYGGYEAQGQGHGMSPLTTPIHSHHQVKSGTIFDNFLITNDEAYAEEFGNETWGVTKVGPGSSLPSPGLGRVGLLGGSQTLSVCSVCRRQKSK